MNDYDRQDLIKQRAGLEPPAHEGDYWSDEDRARLKCLFDMGFGISEIALELRRGEPAICQQIAHMDLFERKRRRHRVRPALPSGCLCKECTADPEACTIRRLQKAAKEAVYCLRITRISFHRRKPQTPSGSARMRFMSC